MAEGRRKLLSGWLMFYEFVSPLELGKWLKGMTDEQVDAELQKRGWA